MKEDICTIPVNEVMVVRDGCPICRMCDTLEEHMLNFILGDAMMEPDVRIETNHQSFCDKHFSLLLGRKNRLAIALILESRLDTIEKTIFSKGFASSKKGNIDKISNAMSGCYICKRVDTALDRLLNTFFILWKKEDEFRANFASQPMICLPHYHLLLKKGQASLDKKSFGAFETQAANVMREGLSSLKSDVTGFCKMFDYHNAGAEWGTKRDAIERAISFETGRRKK